MEFVGFEVDMILHGMGESTEHQHAVGPLPQFCQHLLLK